MDRGRSFHSGRLVCVKMKEKKKKERKWKHENFLCQYGCKYQKKHPQKLKIVVSGKQK